MAGAGLLLAGASVLSHGSAEAQETGKGPRRIDLRDAKSVVVVPPQIRINQINPIPESANAGEPIVLSMEIANRGRKPVNFTTATVTKTYFT